MRKLYRQHKVTKQMLVAQIAPIRYRSNELQLEQLAAVKQAYIDAKQEGFEVLQYDQCLFSASRYDLIQWAPSGQPLCTHNKWSREPVVVVCGFISEETGKHYFSCHQQNSYRGVDMARFIAEIRSRYQPGQKVAFFGDNASINRCREVVEAAAPSPRMAECRLLYNQPYRPDLSKYATFSS